MRKLPFSLVVPFLICSAGVAGGNDLAGVWTFEKEVNTRADGTVVSLPGPGYEGILIYTPDGFVSATIMPKARQWQLAQATLQDLMGSVGEGASTAYAGRYKTDKTSRTVTHTPVASVDPGDTGKPLVRQYEISGDKLLLSGKWSYRGEELKFTVHWRRAK